MSKLEQLSPELVEKGHITKQRIAILGNYEIGILTLGIFSKIRRHRHEANWEIYIEMPWGRVIDVCEIGKSHELENDSHNPLKVLYVKGNNGVPIPNDEDIKNFIV